KELPTALKAKSYGVLLFATSWSPPASMKSNNSTIGGSLNTSSYDAYADYLLSFADTMSKHGAPLYAVSVQNEPDFNPNYESCSWTAQQMLNFVSVEGSKFNNTKLIAAESFHFDHNMTDPILNDPTAQPFLSIVGGHIYGGGLTDYPLARNKGKEVWMTEHLINDTTWTATLGVAEEIYNCMVSNFNAYVWWYIRRSYSFIDESGNITKRGHVMSQFAKFIRPGYTRIGASSPNVNVEVTAYKTDTSLVIVAINKNTTASAMNFSVQNFSVDSLLKYTTSKTKDVENDGTVKLSGGTFSATLDAQSVTTFTSVTGYGGKKLNKKPVANAGADKVITDSDNNGSETITLDGSLSNDTDGTISNYTWAEDSVEIASGISPSLTLKLGTHKIILTVTDNDGATNSDTTEITIKTGVANPQYIWLEAECGTVGSTWDKLTDANASDGKYVMIKSGNNSTAAASENVNDQVIFNLNITDPGSYKLWGRVNTPTANDDSYWVKMDDGSWILWNGLSNGVAGWRWVNVYDSNNSNAALIYNLTAGSHILKFAYREDGAGLDKLYLSNVFIDPTGIGGEAGNCISTSVRSISASNYNLTLSPNPSGGLLTIGYSLEKPERILIEIIDINGKRVRSVVNGLQESGGKTIHLDLGNLTNGTYFCKFLSDKCVQTLPIILLR
ncbi:MAG TPA: T9SS type A sorting domain-containing protein, partial [Bacteroidales bacterium]